MKTWAPSTNWAALLYCTLYTVAVLYTLNTEPFSNLLFLTEFSTQFFDTTFAHNLLKLNISTPKVPFNFHKMFTSFYTTFFNTLFSPTSHTCSTLFLNPFLILFQRFSFFKNCLIFYFPPYDVLCIPYTVYWVPIVQRYTQTQKGQIQFCKVFTQTDLFLEKEDHIKCMRQ